MDDTVKPAPLPEWNRAGCLYAVAMFALAILLLAFAVSRADQPPGTAGWQPVLFFLAYGLFTISVGYRGPDDHYYSFDRIAQVASILVLGPLDAAWINGLASLLYPLHRLRNGAPLRNVVFASLNNAGIMTVSLLAAGYLYVLVGGSVPLTLLSASNLIALAALVITLQVVNDGAMFGLSLARGPKADNPFSPFTLALELGSAATAVLVALVYNRMELPVFLLLLAVQCVGMLALRQFAVMRLRLVGIVEERTRSLLEKSRELERLASHDNLTGLFNRRHADTWLEHQLALAARHPEPLAVALADVDHFKQINDRHSHATGDEVLRVIAALLQERCRGTDILARYGGEEFLLCFPRCGLREAEATCEMLRSALAAIDWSGLGLSHKVTLSFGLAERATGDSLDSLLRRADAHLYMAKNAGRDRIIASD